MLDWEKVLNAAPQWMGNAGNHPCQYFRPDQDAIFGRYYDGTPISEHPGVEEINKYYQFWIAIANSEQKEVLQAMFDSQLAMDFAKAYKSETDYNIVDNAIKWWDKHYRWEVKEFMEYIAWKKGTLRNSAGYDKTKAWKFKGAIPQRVKQFVVNTRPEMCMLKGATQSKFEKIFFSIFSKALIGGN
jgi:hypothetical protein